METRALLAGALLGTVGELCTRLQSSQLLGFKHSSTHSRLNQLVPHAVGLSRQDISLNIFDQINGGGWNCIPGLVFVLLSVILVLTIIIYCTKTIKGLNFILVVTKFYNG